MVKFTIIIPTRERCDTLESSLQTCVRQEYDNLEIIVSDNDSGDNTRDVVESFRDNRVKYVNTGERLSMSANWEFALSQVDSGYIIYLGDDDGMLPEAIISLNRIIEDTGTEAVGWRSAEYHWPRHPDKAVRNMLNIPLGTSLEKRDSKEMLTDVINMKRSYRELPFLYKGAVSYEPVKRISLESGRFFNSLTPDVYSGIVLASVIDSYYYSQSPYSINGASHHSVGTSGFSVGSDKKALNKYLSEDNIPFHPKLVMVPSVPILVAECILQAHEHVAESRQFAVDIKHVMETVARQTVNLRGEQYEAVIGAIKEIARLNNLEGCLSEIIVPRRQRCDQAVRSIPGINPLRKTLLVDCSQFGASNVFEASLLCRHLLALRGMNYFSLRGIAKTTIGLLKREFIKRS